MATATFTRSPGSRPRPVVDRGDAIRRARAGELLGPQDIQAIFQIRKSRYHQLEQEHAFDQFRVHPPIGPKCFSGELIAAYLNGTPVYGHRRGKK